MRVVDKEQRLLGNFIIKSGEKSMRIGKLKNLMKDFCSHGSQNNYRRNDSYLKMKVKARMGAFNKMCLFSLHQMSTFDNKCQMNSIKVIYGAHSGSLV